MAKIPFVDTTVETVSHHIQVRVDQPGPTLKDGRKGRIILEDLNAPPEIVRWLKSKECMRPASGKRVFVWVNDAMIPAGGLIEEEDEEDGTPNLPVPVTGPSADAINFAERYQTRVEALTTTLEKQLAAVRERYQEEVDEARKACQEEIKRCDGQIEEARARLAVEREREDDELEKMCERRRAYADERSALSEDLKKDSETYRGVREQLAAGIQAKDTIATVVEGMTALQTAGIPVADLVGKLTAILSKKAGV